jgi:hypothetical protein
MKLDPAKTLMTAGVLALGLSGGVVMAAYGPTITSSVTSAIGGPTANLMQGGGLHGADVFGTAATYIGISVDQLRTELGMDKSLADVAVAHGKSRDGLIQALTAAAQTNITTLVDQKGIGAKTGRGPGAPGGPRANVLGDQLAAATYFGTSTADLRTKMQAGQTLAQIAAATPGKSRDGLVAALTADATAKITAAEQAGTISAEQATALRTNLAARIAALVDSTRPAGPRGFGR